MSSLNLDLGSFRDIPPVRRYYETPRVTITENGHFSMNGALKSAVGTQREFRVKISPDGCKLAMYPQESPNVRFSDQGGCVAHMPLTRLLKEMGFQMPVRYTMEWKQKEQVWVGVCDEMPLPPALSVLEKEAGRKKRATTKRCA